MKLKPFNLNTCPRIPGKHYRKPMLTIHKKGSIYFNADAIKLMELNIGDGISLGQDEAEPTCWYCYKDPDGFKLRRHNSFKNSTNAGLVTNHRELSIRVLKSLELDVNETNFLTIASKPTLIEGRDVQYWGILLKN